MLCTPLLWSCDEYYATIIGTLYINGSSKSTVSTVLCIEQNKPFYIKYSFRSVPLMDVSDLHIPVCISLFETLLNTHSKNLIEEFMKFAWKSQTIVYACF